MLITLSKNSCYTKNAEGKNEESYFHCSIGGYEELQKRLSVGGNDDSVVQHKSTIDAKLNFKNVTYYIIKNVIWHLYNLK